MEKALNAQIELEAYASFLYLSMASWCDSQGMDGSSKFMYRQSSEEHFHMMRIFKYVLEMDAIAIVPAIAKPDAKFKSITAMFEMVYKHEQKVTNSINKLVDIAINEKDHATHNFLQWYVEEQREEEALMRNILDKIRLIGDGAQSLYFIDKEIEAINAAEAKAEANKEEEV